MILNMSPLRRTQLNADRAKLREDVFKLGQPNYEDFTWGQWLDFNLIVNCVKLYLAKVIVYNKTTVHRS